MGGSEGLQAKGAAKQVAGKLQNVFGKAEDAMKDQAYEVVVEVKKPGTS